MCDEGDFKSLVWNLRTPTRGTERKRNSTPGMVARTYLTDIVSTSRGLRARRVVPRRDGCVVAFAFFLGKNCVSRSARFLKKGKGCVDPKKPRLEGWSINITVKRPRRRAGSRDLRRTPHRATHGDRPLGGRERRARVSRRPGRVLRRGCFRARARGATKTRAGTRGRVFSRFSRPTAPTADARGRVFPTSR